MLRDWEDLPDFMRLAEVRPYWEILNKKKWQLSVKRSFDVIFALMLIILLMGPMIVMAVLIKSDSKGSVFYTQIRITAYGRKFRIHKFRTMVSGADKLGSAVTVKDDKRITRAGRTLRKYHLDELPQLFDVLVGNMSFVGKRPEVPKYVRQYKKEYIATLLLPAGITSDTSIRYKDEMTLLAETDDVDKVYMEKILPEKMKMNLRSLKRFSLLNDLKTILNTVISVFLNR